MLPEEHSTCLGIDERAVFAGRAGRCGSGTGMPQLTVQLPQLLKLSAAPGAFTLSLWRRLPGGTSGTWQDEHKRRAPTH
jgi:hypothetical protein